MLSKLIKWSLILFALYYSFAEVGHLEAFSTFLKGDKIGYYASSLATCKLVVFFWSQFFWQDHCIFMCKHSLDSYLCIYLSFHLLSKINIVYSDFDRIRQKEVGNTLRRCLRDCIEDSRRTCCLSKVSSLLRSTSRYSSQRRRRNTNSLCYNENFFQFNSSYLHYSANHNSSPKQFKG